MENLQDYPATATSEYVHSPSCNPPSTQLSKFTLEDEWALSPMAWLPPSSPCDESPLSTLSTPSTYHESSWNPFDQSFASAQQEDVQSFASSPRSATFMLPACNAQPRYLEGDPRGNGKACVPMSAIKEPVHNGFTEEDEDHEDTPTPQMNLNARVPTMQTRQMAWGSARRQPRRESTASSSSKLSSGNRSRNRKPSGALPPPSPTQPSHRLRSTSSTTTTSSANNATTPATTTTKKRPSSSHPARTNHNQVEKEYRNRLNGQFETLLETLPHDAEMEGEKRVSKAEVLVLAKNYIAKLEREKTELEEVNGSLEERIDGLRRRWVGLGGVVLP